MQQPSNDHLSKFISELVSVSSCPARNSAHWLIRLQQRPNVYLLISINSLKKLLAGLKDSALGVILMTWYSHPIFSMLTNSFPLLLAEGMDSSNVYDSCSEGQTIAETSPSDWNLSHQAPGPPRSSTFSYCVCLCIWISQNTADSLPS